MGNIIKNTMSQKVTGALRAKNAIWAWGGRILQAQGAL